MLRTVTAKLGVLVILGACGSDETKESGSDAGGASDADGAAGQGYTVSEGCKGTEPARTVAMPEGFGIDETEVTRCQYEVWLAAGPSTDGQPAECSWNDDFTPGCEWPPGEKGDLPVQCVDWCDAFSYCEALGKRLCGKIGGGPNGYDDLADHTKSQWFAACSAGGTYVFPYGNEYDAERCNGGDNDATGCDHGSCELVSGGTYSRCQSIGLGYGGVYDLSGNVWEWEDACDGSEGASDACRVRGGATNYGQASLTCAAEEYFVRNVNTAVGFRCCSKP